MYTKKKLFLNLMIGESLTSHLRIASKVFFLLRGSFSIFEERLSILIKTDNRIETVLSLTLKMNFYF